MSIINHKSHKTHNRRLIGYYQFLILQSCKYSNYYFPFVLVDTFSFDNHVSFKSCTYTRASI